MPRQHMSDIAGRLFPTSFVGSYPRPSWYDYNLRSRDIVDALQEAEFAEAYTDALRIQLADQQEVGIDVLADPHLWYDKHQGFIGSFGLYNTQRLAGTETRVAPNRRLPQLTQDSNWMEVFGSVSQTQVVATGPLGRGRFVGLLTSARASDGEDAVGLYWEIAFEYPQRSSILRNRHSTLGSVGHTVLVPPARSTARPEAPQQDPHSTHKHSPQPVVTFAARHPQRVRRLVLYGAVSPSGDRPMSEQAGAKSSHWQRCAARTPQELSQDRVTTAPHQAPCTGRQGRSPDHARPCARRAARHSSG